MRLLRVRSFWILSKEAKELAMKVRGGLVLPTGSGGRRRWQIFVDLYSSILWVEKEYTCSRWLSQGLCRMCGHVIYRSHFWNTWAWMWFPFIVQLHIVGAGHSLQNAVGNGGILYDRTLLELLPGFLSSFPRPRHCFAEALPRGVPDAELTNLIQEELVHRISS